MFSRVVFEDFLYTLFAEVHVARGEHALGRVAAYVSPEARKGLETASKGLVEIGIVR